MVSKFANNLFKGFMILSGVAICSTVAIGAYYDEKDAHKAQTPHQQKNFPDCKAETSKTVVAPSGQKYNITCAP